MPPPYDRDSAIIVLREGEDGFFVSYYTWGINPPPVNLAVLDNTIPPWTQRQDRISVDKTALKAEIGAFVDNFFAL